MGDPILRIPLAEAEAHRAELAAVKKENAGLRLDVHVSTAAQRGAILNAAYANDDDACLLRQSVVLDADGNVDVVASIDAFAAKAKALARRVNEQAVDLQEARNRLHDQVEETRRYCDLYLKTDEAKAKGLAFKAKSEQRCVCGHLHIEHVGTAACVLCNVRRKEDPTSPACTGFLAADVEADVLAEADEARASITIDEGEDAVVTVTDPPTKTKPVDTRPHVATRRDAHGRRFWDGLGWTDSAVSARDCAPLDTETLAKLKPRGSRLVALDDVPALLAEDAAKDAAKASTTVTP